MQVLSKAPTATALTVRGAHPTEHVFGMSCWFMQVPGAQAASALYSLNSECREPLS